MDFLIGGLLMISGAMEIHGAMEFSDDNRPKVTYVKHISYQEKLQKAGDMKKHPNKLINYNVMIDAKTTKNVVIENNEQEFRYLIVEPQGWENGKEKYYARMACSKTYKTCKSLTNSYDE